jgi:hypothetical protein
MYVMVWKARCDSSKSGSRAAVVNTLITCCCVNAMYFMDFLEHRPILKRVTGLICYIPHFGHGVLRT